MRQARSPTRRRFALLVLVTVALFFLHLSAFVVFVPSALGVVVGLGRPLRGDLRALAAGAVRRVAFLAPAGGCALGWLVVGKLTLHGESLSDAGEIGHMRLGRALHALPLWQSDLFRDHVDEACAIVWWGAYLVILVTGMRHARLFGRPLLAVAAPFAVAIGVFLVTPYRVGAGAMLNVRLAPVITLMALLALRPRRGVWGTAPLVAAALATVVMAGNAAREMSVIAARDLGDFDALLARVRPASRLVSVTFEPDSDEVHFPPWIHVGAYHRARTGGVASFSFTELAHWPIHYREGAAPPKKQDVFWEFVPCGFRNAVDGAYYDYVLVQGEVNPFRDQPPGPAFDEVARTGRFVLYEKHSSAVWPAWSTADQGPCVDAPARAVAR